MDEVNNFLSQQSSIINVMTCKGHKPLVPTLTGPQVTCKTELAI
jgi:hypothetical protein